MAVPGFWRGVVPTFDAYDGLNRPTRQSYNDTPRTPEVVWCYDGKAYSGGSCTGSRAALQTGRLTAVGSTVSVTNLGSYDGLGRVTASSQETEGQTYGFTYQYNLAGGMTRMSYPSGKVVSFVYDGAGRVNTVKKGEPTSLDTYASKLGYHPQGAISTMKLGNGVVETTSYNSRLQMTGIGARRDTTTLLQVTNEYGTTNNNGNVVSQSISRSSLPGMLTQGFGYDGVNRIKTAGEGTAWTRTFGYDRYGNQWVSAWTGQLSPGSFTPQSGSWYDANNRMVGAPSGQFDGAGNQTQLGGYRYEYDGEGHQRSSTINSVTTAYGHDGDGRRVKKVTGASTQVYVYDALGNLAAEYGALDSAGTRYLTVDHLGSTRLVTDGSGGEKVCYDYLPSGEEIPAGVNGRSSACYGAAGPAQRFTGKERDAETGLDYFGARYFSAAQGRFTSPDPTFLNILKVVNPQRWNLYSYGINNPLKYVDPDGEEAIAIRYPGYLVGLPKGLHAPLGHGGVVMVARDGSTHYFEYGRYPHSDNVPGVVRNAGQDNTPTPPLERDASGKFTAQSMGRLLSTLSQASGKGGAVDALVFDTADIEDAVMEAYLEERQRQNTDPSRQNYSLSSHNCGTLMCDAFERAGHPAPNRFVTWGATPGAIFDLLRAISGPSQEFSYEPKKKEKITSRICYENGVCQ